MVQRITVEQDNATKATESLAYKGPWNWIYGSLEQISLDIIWPCMDEYMLF